MDCEACTDRMVELLFEELPDADAEATRAHLDDCESCREAYARLSTGQELASMLAFEEPPATVRASVMQAARAKAAERAPAEEPARPAAAVERTATPRDGEGDGGEEDRGIWASILHWIGGFAMRPQLAMAMTLVLMVGIGLWYLDVGRRHDPTDAQAILDSAPGDEAGPSRTLSPAEPLELETDPRTGRIRARGEAEASAPLAQREVADEEAAPEPEPEAAQADGVDTVDALADESARAEADADGEVITEALDSPEAALAEMQLAEGESFGGDDRAAEAPRQPGQAQTAPAYAGGVQQAPMPGAGGRMEAEEAEAPADEVARPEGNAPQLLASAMHRQARGQRAAGDCRTAVRTYGQLLSRYPTYAQAPEARLEAAECYRRTGQLSAARRMLEAASRTPRVATRARRELAELSAAERAHDRATATETPAEAAPRE